MLMRSQAPLALYRHERVCRSVLFCAVLMRREVRAEVFAPLFFTMPNKYVSETEDAEVAVSTR